MSVRAATYAIVLGLLSLLPGAWGQADTPAIDAALPVVVCPIEGMIDDGIAVVVERAVREAKGAQRLIFVIDTPGGRVDSAITITNHILEAPCLTMAYIKGMGAISAGALISYSCDKIVMAPATNIGASTPVTMGGVESSEAMNEKSMSFVRAKFRALGEAKGHNPLLGEAMVEPEIEVRARRQPDGSYAFYRLAEDGEVVDEASAKKDGTAEKVIDTVFEDLEQDIPVSLDGVKDSLKQALSEAAKQQELKNQNTEEAPAAETPRDVLPDGSIVVSRAGELLTLTAQEAEELGLSAMTSGSLEAALGEIGLAAAPRIDIVPTWSEELFRWLTSPMISGLLLMVGFGGIYVEIRTPGFGLPGILGACCLALFFGSYLVIGLADWLDILLVVLGIALILVEVFVLPGFGVVGLLGGICLLAGLYLSMVNAPIPEFSWQFDRLRDAGQTVTFASVLFTVFAFLSWKVFPRTPFYGWLVLSAAQHAHEGYVIQTDEEEKSVIGMRGVSISVLRPAGRGRFGDKTLDVMTRGEFIDPDRPIRVIRVEGNRLLVSEEKEIGHT